MGFTPEKYSKKEAEDINKRVSDLDKDSTRYLKGTDNKLNYREAAHEIAKEEDKIRERLKKSNLSVEEINELGDDKSTDVLTIFESQKGEAVAIEKSLTDSLTGLGNEAKFKLFVGSALGTGRIDTQKEKRKHALIRIDLDHFKEVNDTYGHAEGDHVLVSVAEAMLEAVRTDERGSVYRKGGDEFVVFLPSTNLEGASLVAERIREAIGKLIIKTDASREIKITASLGCSTTDQIPPETPREKYLEMLDKNADAAAYFSKETGKDKVTSFDKKVMEYKLVSDLWAESEKNQAIQQLNEGKNCQEIVDSIQNISEAFKENAMSCGCSDGRIHEHRIGRPGQGILAGVEAMVEYIRKMIEEGKVTDKFEITSHEGCGAAKIVYNQLKDKGKLPPDTTPDGLGINFAKDVLEAARKKFPDVTFTYRHIEAGKMDEIHNERAIYFDGTGKINIKAVPDLPSGFTFTHMPEINEEITTNELEALCGIALGHHGFGKERFKSENPFRIIISAKDKEQLNNLRRIADSVAGKFNGEVKVDGFIV